MRFYALSGVDAPFDPTDALVTSNVLSPIRLATFRLIAAFYLTVAIVFSLTWRGVVEHQAGSYFAYFTELTNTGLCAYFWASGIHTLLYARQLEWKKEKATHPLQQWPRFLQFLHLLLYSTIATYPFIVSLVYWTLLSQGSFQNAYESWFNISFHILDSCFVALEIVLGQCNLHWAFLPFVVIIAYVYLGLAYLVHSTAGFWTYDFLDPSKKGSKVGIYIIAITVAEILVFVLVYYLGRLRDRLLSGKAARRASYELADV